MLIYLGLSAVAVFIVALVLSVLGTVSALAATHLVLTVAILPLIVAAMTHFVPVLTRGAGASRPLLLLPLLLQGAGLLVVLHFSGEAGVGALHAAAGIALLVASAFACWLIFRARHTLGKPHPCWRWYLAAVAFLMLGLALVPAMYAWPVLRQSLRLLHLHLNTLGFIGLTAIATLQVLLPTVLSGPDAEATARLRRDLPLACAGVLACGLGAAFWWPLSLAGAGLLFAIAARIGIAWLKRYGWRTLVGDGASAALLAALCGFMLLLVFGAWHGPGLMRGTDAVSAFMVLFLLPLVTGALSQLLPVWRYPGRRLPARDRMRELLARGGAMRAALFVAGGVLLAFGQPEGLWPTAAGLLLFLQAIVRAR